MKRKARAPAPIETEKETRVKISKIRFSFELISNYHHHHRWSAQTLEHIVADAHSLTRTPWWFRAHNRNPNKRWFQTATKINTLCEPRTSATSIAERPLTHPCICIDLNGDSERARGARDGSLPCWSYFHLDLCNFCAALRTNAKVSYTDTDFAAQWHMPACTVRYAQYIFCREMSRKNPPHLIRLHFSMFSPSLSPFAFSTFQSFQFPNAIAMRNQQKYWILITITITKV